jgi:hypothetical protein
MKNYESIEFSIQTYQQNTDQFIEGHNKNSFIAKNKVQVAINNMHQSVKAFIILMMI